MKSNKNCIALKSNWIDLIWFFRSHLNQLWNKNNNNIINQKKNVRSAKTIELRNYIAVSNFYLGLFRNTNFIKFEFLNQQISNRERKKIVYHDVANNKTVCTNFSLHWLELCVVAVPCPLPITIWNRTLDIFAMSSVCDGICRDA